MDIDATEFQQARSNAIEQWKICMDAKDESWYIDEPHVNQEKTKIYGKIFLLAPHDRHCFGQILECMLNWNYIDGKGVFSIDFPPLLFTKFVVRHINMIQNQNQMQWSKFPNDKENDLTKFLPEIINLVFPKDTIEEKSSFANINNDNNCLPMQKFWHMYSKKSYEMSNENKT